MNSAFRRHGTCRSDTHNQNRVLLITEQSALIGHDRRMGDPFERTFFVTTVTSGRRSLFQSDRVAKFFLGVLMDYRGRGLFRLHEFVVMPDHLHLLITPSRVISLEKSMQYIKGGFSHRYRAEFRSRLEFWERSFTNHRIRGAEDYDRHKNYIHLNPVRAGLAERPMDYPYSSASRALILDSAPAPEGGSIVAAMSRP
jgi:putative transposase